MAIRPSLCCSLCPSDTNTRYYLISSAGGSVPSSVCHPADPYRPASQGLRTTSVCVPSSSSAASKRKTCVVASCPRSRRERSAAEIPDAAAASTKVSPLLFLTALIACARATPPPQPSRHTGPSNASDRRSSHPSPASALNHASVFTSRKCSTDFASSSSSFGFASTIASVRARLIATLRRFSNKRSRRGAAGPRGSKSRG
jgi:hypothetical protein